MLFTFSYQGKPYEFDDARMGLGEARWVKGEIGMTGPEFFQAVQKLDPDAIACLVVLAIRRAGNKDATMESVCADENGYFEFVETTKVHEKAEPKKPVRRAPSNK